MGAAIGAAKGKLRAAVNRTPGTPYQAATDGFVRASGQRTVNIGYILGYQENVTPPTIIVAGNYWDQGATAQDIGIFFEVKKGDYYKVAVSNMANTICQWIPFY